jgi:hypothetical protein
MEYQTPVGTPSTFFGGDIVRQGQGGKPRLRRSFALPASRLPRVGLPCNVTLMMYPS